MQGMARPVLVAAGLALLCAIPLVHGIAAPFVTLADNNTAAFAQPARNFLRHGLAATRLGLVIDMGEASPPFDYNNHHPPLASLATAAVFGIAGVSDRAARYYPALCTLGSALALFALWRRVRGEGAAALAVAMMALFPAFGHYGKMLGEEAPTLFWGLLSVLLYAAWKGSPDPAPPWKLAASLVAYAIGCLSGWPGFYAGPLIMLDALFTLRRRPAARRAALGGFAATGLLVFAAAIGQIAVVSGGVSEIASVARERIAAREAGSPAPGDAGGWIAREGIYFLRMYGWGVVVPAGLGLIAAIVALARRRARPEGISLVLILAGIGVAHPLIFQAAARDHEWMLSPLMPLLAIAAAEGIRFLGALAARGCGLLGAPPRDTAILQVLVVAAPLIHLVAGGLDGTAALRANPPGCAWPILGREIAVRAPRGSPILSNFPFAPLRSAPLRFYADRRTIVVTSLASFEERLGHEDPALFVRFLDLPMESALEERLRAFPSHDLGIFRIHDLREGAPAGGPETAPAEELVPLDADFAGRMRLTGYSITLPTAPPPPPRGLLATYLAAGAGEVSGARLVRITSRWSVTGATIPHWSMIAGLTRESGPDEWISLPSLLTPELREISIDAWGERREFLMESAAYLEPGRTPGPWEIRFGLFDRGEAVPPEIPGRPLEGREVVVAGTILLPY